MAKLRECLAVKEFFSTITRLRVSYRFETLYPNMRLL